ncbi:MAG: DUF234 domain-containing protein [Campylobacter sp.]|nr:DUF234 domain-containing protein [Campylobacter sp.]
MNQALMKLARSDRKWLNIHKIMPQNKAKQSYAKLFEQNLISIEYSRETRPQRQKHQLLSKANRRYKVENKIHFTSHFTRFWFRFIQPNLTLLQNGDSATLMTQIKKEFDEYASLGFELMCAEWLELKGVKNLGSFWHKNIEIDLLGIKNEQILVAEVKYKATKICKNVLNLLNLKCAKLGIKPALIVLFSKSGFSEKLYQTKGVKLVDITQMTELKYG